MRDVAVRVHRDFRPLRRNEGTSETQRLVIGGGQIKAPLGCLAPPRPRRPVQAM